jgi:N-acetylglutamate synthase-like GNAT family acetyltransferase
LIDPTKVKKFNYKIEKITSDLDKKNVNKIISKYINSEYPPYLKVLLPENNKIIGGATVKLETDELNDEVLYYFDIAVDEKYWGSGIYKSLVEYLLKDATDSGADAMFSELANKDLESYLKSIGFSIEKTSYDITYVRKELR